MAEETLICGCGRLLIPALDKEGKRIGVTHTTEDEDWHIEYFSSLRPIINNSKLESEAAILYPYHQADKITQGVFNCNKDIDLQRSAHITCARMYTGEIEKLKAEVEHWKDEFEAEALTLRELKHKHNIE